MSVRCGYCGKYGHNSRTCPERTEKSKEWSESHYKKQGRKKGSTTMCSYCGLIGHNRRTCPHLKRRKQEALKTIEGSVSRALLEFQSWGAGVGALYEETTYWKESTASYMITGDKLEAGVTYREERYREGDDGWGNTSWSRNQVPTFRIWVNATKMFGDDRAPVRTEVSKVFVHSDEDRQIAGLHHLIPFAKESCNNKWLGKSSNSFPSVVAERLRDIAVREVNDYYSNKENKHPEYANETWFDNQEIMERHGA